MLCLQVLIRIKQASEVLSTIPSYNKSLLNVVVGIMITSTMTSKRYTYRVNTKELNFLPDSDIKEKNEARYLFRDVQSLGAKEKMLCR